MSDSSEDAGAPAPPVEDARPRWPSGQAVGLAGAFVAVVAVLAATPFWAPPLIRLLPWGPTAEAPKGPATDPALAAIRAETRNEAASVQQLGQRVATLEARPAPDQAALQPLQQRIAALEARPALDFSGVQQKLAALDKTTADLADKLGALDKTEKQQNTTDPKITALALTLLQIRDAIETGRPFDAEYQALVALSRDHPDIASAAAPLAAAAQSGVASRAVLTERLRQLAPQIATARPPPKDKLKAQIVARLRSLVTIRRIEGPAETPAEAGVDEAQRDLASGDLAAAATVLDKLADPARAAAEPWLNLARSRLAVETALRQLQAALTAALGNGAAKPEQGG